MGSIPNRGNNIFIRCFSNKTLFHHSTRNISKNGRSMCFNGGFPLPIGLCGTHLVRLQKITEFWRFPRGADLNQDTFILYFILQKYFFFPKCVIKKIKNFKNVKKYIATKVVCGLKHKSTSLLKHFQLISNVQAVIHRSKYFAFCKYLFGLSFKILKLSMSWRSGTAYFLKAFCYIPRIAEKAEGTWKSSVKTFHSH